MRIVRRDVIDYAQDAKTEVSTPLTRKAELKELRLLAMSAAMRRRRILTGLIGTGLLCLGLALFGVVPWWVPIVPVVGLIGFVIAARVGVAMMHKRFDARAAKVKVGFDEADETQIIQLEAAETSTEKSVDLTAPEASGALWEPLPVPTPTYVQKPLVPRTVRTIDLSAPVGGEQVVPTAERPGSSAEEVEDSQTGSKVVNFRRRAAGR